MTRAFWMPACLLGLALASAVGQAQTGTCDPASAGLVPYYHQLPQVIFYSQAGAPDKPMDGAMSAADCLHLWQILWTLGKYDEAHAMAQRACQACPGNLSAEHARVLAQIVLEQHAAQPSACCPATGCRAMTATCCSKTASESPCCPTACGTASCCPTPCAAGPSCGTCPCEEHCSAHKDDSCCSATTCASCAKGSCCAADCCKKTCACGAQCACGKDCCCAKKTCACGPNCSCAKGTCACGPNCACCKKTCACGPNCACCKKTCACGPNCACKENGKHERLVRQLKALQRMLAQRCPPGLGLPVFTAPLPPGSPMMMLPDQTLVEMPMPPMPCPGMPCPGMHCPPMMGLPGMPPCFAPGVCGQPMQAPVPAMPVSRPVESMIPSPVAAPAMPANREPIEITVKGGRVHIHAPRFQATCDHLSYQESSDQVVLTGKVRLTIVNGSGKDKVTAERVEVGVHRAQYQVTPAAPSGEVRRQRKPDASPCSTFQPKACWPCCPCE